MPSRRPDTAPRAWCARSLDERRDRWRPLFRARLAPLAADARSLTEAALQLNARAWGLWGIEFRADSTPDVLSPFQARPAQQAHASTLCDGACPLVGRLAEGPGCLLWSFRVTASPPAPGLCGHRTLPCAPHSCVTLHEMPA